ncbi:response regulator transcription factor [Enterobacter cloacae complex sp. P40RS]|uniref:Response regulator transcription factor n=1 Tax=Enterobacter pasteurii TaxID=3029761 RepID=A0ABR9QCN1_9ENTR|nr:LuxR C-terminal-related transcriptional regulator [Enterobacter pasteurii]MBE4856562.1 response regulator transcription factor [Enterobacter pasteurii]MBE4863971.1 response regulator transcription factor [Enterobacter cloacae complex sp. P40C2]MBE4876315.1 response regulator transcription factor [Enterobacter cloacae complex sp. P40C]
MVFYKINIFKEIIFQALHDLLPDYVLKINLVDSTEQALAAVADNGVDIFLTEFNYLLNHKEWSTEVSSRFTTLCKTHNVRRVLLVPELPYGLLKKVLQMKFELTISQQDEFSELKKEIPALLMTEMPKPLISSWLRQAMRAGSRSRSILSAREWEVLHLIVEGFSTTEIARHRNRSVSTIATQKHNAMKKLNLSNHSELIKYLHTVGKMEE